MFNAVLFFYGPGRFRMGSNRIRAETYIHSFTLPLKDVVKIGH